MEKKLSYGVMLTLKEIILRKVTVILWNKTVILASLDEFAVEDKVKDDISRLGLPPHLMENMKSLVKTIELEIRKWKFFHENYLNISHESFDKQILKQLHWTISGTIDYKKTAENLIPIKILSTYQRYRLACLYCLDDYIPVLWKKLPIWRRRYFLKENPFDHYYTKSVLEFSWPHILKKDETKLNRLAAGIIGNQGSFNQYAFEYSARKGNIAAAQYFFQKLTEVEKEISLFRTAEAALRHQLENYPFRLLEEFPMEKLSDTICYLLSQMSPEQQKEICKEKPCNVLTCLLDWPRQDLFWDIAELVWPFLTAIDYINVINRITEKITVGYYLTKLFQEFFVRGPNAFKKYFVNIENQSFFTLRVFFDLRDTETIKLIFMNLDFDDRRKLVSYKNTFKLFYESATRGDWYLVELCLQEATLSKEDKEELKEAYCDFLSETNTTISDNNLREHVWKKFHLFFEENQVKAPSEGNSERILLSED